MEEIARESSLWSEAKWRNGFQFFISILLSYWRKEGEGEEGKFGPLRRGAQLLSGDLETGDEMPQLCTIVLLTDEHQRLLYQLSTSQEGLQKYFWYGMPLDCRDDFIGTDLKHERKRHA